MRILSLIALHSKEPLSPSDFAKDLDVSKSRISNILSGLAQEKLITFEPNEDDRRRIAVKLTAKGQKMLVKNFEVTKGRIRLLEEKLGSQKLKQVTSLLSEIAEIIKQME